MGEVFQKSSIAVTVRLFSYQQLILSFHKLYLKYPNGEASTQCAETKRWLVLSSYKLLTLTNKVLFIYWSVFLFGIVTTYQKMAKQLYISQIKPHTKDWRAKVLVIEKCNPQEMGENKTLQKLVLLDEQNNKVQGVIWNNEIQLLHDALQPFRTYYIGGAKVDNIKPKYLSSAKGMTVEWILTKTTVIRPVVDDQEMIAYPNIERIPFSNLPLLTNNGETIDMIAAVIAVKPPREVQIKGIPTPLQECTIIDQDLKPMLLTLWGSFTKYQGIQLAEMIKTIPVIMCKWLRLKTYSGVSLATTPSSFIAVEPNITQVREFRNWIENNMYAIKTADYEDLDIPMDPMLPYNKQQEITPVSHIQPDSKNAWIDVSVSIANIRQQFTYRCCPKCSCGTEALPEEDFLCSTCRQMQIAIPRCKVLAEMTDDSGSINATFFDKSGEYLLHHSAKELSVMDDQALVKVVESTEEWLKCRPIIAEVRAMRNKYADKNTRDTVQKWYVKQFGESRSTPTPQMTNKSIAITVDSDLAKHPLSTTCDVSTECNEIQKPPLEDATSSPPKKLKLKTN